ncbi:MAG: PAS domain S-box protein [Mariprofundaceae bacterium]|nr:PAS domain S-box protein [Mariprofundaceae bacterium]
MSAKPLQILLVDDEQSHVDLIRRALIPAGKKLDLKLAGTLADARKILKKTSPDLMIADYLLPDGKGIELLPGDLHKLTYPVVILTSHGNELIAAAAMKAGAIDYIVKSNETFAEMPHIIKRVLREWRHITKHRQAEEKASALNKILEESMNEIYIFDSETLKFIQINYGARLNLGYEMDELYHLTLLDIKPEFTNVSFEKLVESLRTGKKEKIQFTTVHRRKDGSLYPVEIHLQLSTLESRRVFVAIVLDITERKQSEKVMQDEKNRTRQIIDTARDAFVSMDEDGIITDWNPQTEKLFGWSRKEALGHLMTETIIPETYREAHTKGLKHYLTTDEGPLLYQHIEISALHRDGHTFPVELSIVPVRSGSSISFNAFIRDISARQKAKKALKASLVGTIVAISKAVEARDPYTAGHQQRVARLARSIAQEMDLDSNRIDGLRMGATIHDIGKIHLPAEILSKPTKLTETEFELIKTHTQVGFDILKDIEFPWPIADIAYQHHERLDGTGYPQGLKGDEICLEARIVAVADVVEAISSHRPYRPALGMDVALKEIETHRGKWYEPAAVDACLKVFREKKFSFDDNRLH